MDEGIIIAIIFFAIFSGIVPIIFIFAGASGAKQKEALKKVASDLGLQYSDGKERYDAVSENEEAKERSQNPSAFSGFSAAYSSQNTKDETHEPLADEKINATFSNEVKAAYFSNADKNEVQDTRVITEYEAQVEKMPLALKKFLLAQMPWKLSGLYNGVKVMVYPETRSSGKSSTTYTLVRAYYKNPLNYKLTAAHEGFFTKLGKSLFGMQDVEIGDAVFDPLVRIKTSDEYAAKDLFSRSETRDAMIDALSFNAGIRAENSFIHFEKVGVITDTETLRTILDKLSAFAKSIS